MTRILVLAILFLTAKNTLADVKNKEKAKFELISSIEVLVNIEECRKSIHKIGESTELPRICNRLPYLSKYFFNPQKDRSAIDEFLNNEEAKITEEALKLVQVWNITKLGKITLSEKCVKNKDPMDLDLYLAKIKGQPVIMDDDAKEKHVERDTKLEPRNPAQESHKLSK